MASMRMDPMCGMELEETDAVAQFQHKGDILYFCSLECKRKFCELVEETSKAFKDGDALAKETDSNESR